MTVSIAAGKASSALLESPSMWHSLPFACGPLLVPLALVRRRKALLQLAILVLIVGAISACSGSGGGAVTSGGSGGGTGGSGNNPVTSAGTYSVPVTVTSAGVSHAVTLTLTVD